MGFWIFMLIADLLIPLTIIGFGRYFCRRSPKEINVLFGYRTTMSMKNLDTWDFAHKYCGKIWFVSGLILLPLTVLVMLLTIGETKDVIGNVGSVICFIQLAVLLGAIPPTEHALKVHFDQDGNRR